MPADRDPFGKIFELTTLQQKVDQWQREGLKVVFTNGVFDLLHPGHMIYLQEAAELGDRLVVGLNSDASVKRLGKGSNRPINSEQDRAIVMSALRMVDALCIFDQDTPLKLIQTLLPDVLVKGGDYRIEDIVGAKEVMESGGNVKSLQFVEGYSTTSIEQKIKSTS